jgi:LTXXQ motif family protein
MIRYFLLPLAALAAWTFAPLAQAASDQSSQPATGRMHDWAEDHEAMLDARLAGLKAGLRLTSDQEKLWPPFEAAVRDAAKLHMDQMKSMMDRMQKMRDMMQSMQQSEDMEGMDADGEALSPIDRLEAMGQRMSERGAAIEKVADAAKPLYGNLDDSQKRRFVLLGRAMFMMGRGHPGMEMMRMTGRMRGGAMGREDTGGNSDRMERMEQGPDDEEDNRDDQ